MLPFDYASDIPEWFSDQMIDGNMTDILLVPVRMFRDPFTFNPNKLVLCEVLDTNRLPTCNAISKNSEKNSAGYMLFLLIFIVVFDILHTGRNQRSKCAEIMEKEEVGAFHPWFGMEQEYFLFGLDGRPIGWPPLGCPFPGGLTKII